MSKIVLIRNIAFALVGIVLAVEALLILTAKITPGSYIVAGATIGSLAIALILEAIKGFEMNSKK